MNKKYHSLGHVLFAATIFGGPSDPPAASLLNVPLVTLVDGTTWNATSHVTLGMGRIVVVQELGEPSLQLTRDIWAYTDFHATNLPRAERGTVLVVVFANDEVSRIRVTNEKSFRALVARQKNALVRPATVAAR